jgi:NitT/TauT family transport system substrate-binding protein
VEAGSLALNGGGAEAAADDFAFFSLAGQIEGDPATLKVEDFWDVAALDRAVAKLGKK